MILVDFSKIAHWESAGEKVNFQIIAVLNWLINLDVYKQGVQDMEFPGVSKK